MNKTVVLVVSLVISIILMYSAIDFFLTVLLAEEEALTISNVAAFASSDSIVVSWKTNAETDGIVEYANTTISGALKYYSFSKTHAITIEPIGPGPYYYNITSCNINGACVDSKGHEITP